MRRAGLEKLQQARKTGVKVGFVWAFRGRREDMSSICICMQLKNKSNSVLSSEWTVWVVNNLVYGFYLHICRLKFSKRKCLTWKCLLLSSSQVTSGSSPLLGRRLPAGPLGPVPGFFLLEGTFLLLCLWALTDSRWLEFITVPSWDQLLTVCEERSPVREIFWIFGLKNLLIQPLNIKILNHICVS